MIPVTLYIHMPWCEHKCPYCDFNSHPLKTVLPEARYIQCLIDDFKQNQHLLSERPISAIFIGGGTPSLFSAESIERLLSKIHNIHTLTENVEITLEANPGSSEQKRFKGFRRAGVNRLSIGVQSFQNRFLKKLQRVHSTDQAIKAVDMAYAAGFNHINIDLMYGLPGQLVEDALFDLDIAASLKTPHLSWYQLTLEPNTLFYKHPPVLPHDDRIIEMEQAGLKLLSQRGFKRYEVSAYCRDNQQCQHNRNYWLFGDYIGIGAGAHSKLTLIDRVVRQQKARNPTRYMDPKLDYTHQEYDLAAKDRCFEFMLNALRLYEPIPKKLFEQRTNIPASQVKTAIQTAQKRGFMHTSSVDWQTTDLGKQYLNELLQLFI